MVLRALLVIAVSVQAAAASQPHALAADAPVHTTAGKTSATTELTRYLFEKNDYGVRQGSRTDGILVLQNGQTLFERYARGYDENKPHIMWSISKTVTALLYGVALKDKKIRLDQSICDFAKFPRAEQCAIQIRHVLEWTTSIRWKEEYEKTVTPSQASILAMLYGEGRHDMAAFIKAQPLEKGFKPGELWHYSSGDSMLAAYLLAQIYKGQDLRQVFKDKIFAPLGLKNWTFEGDGAGTLGGAYYFNSSARDLALIGELLLGHGVFRGKKIFDESFWKFMTTVPEAYKTARLDLKDVSISGAHIWLNLKGESGDATHGVEPGIGGVMQPYPAAPVDAIAARGHWGQYLVVIPSVRAVIVRLGDTRDGSVTLPVLIEKTMPLLKQRLVKSQPADVAEAGKTKGGGAVLSLSSRLGSTVATETWDLDFSDNRMRLGAGFTAKSLCSCLYVSKIDEKACRDYASLDQVNPRLTVDASHKKVTSSFFFLFSREAEFVSPEVGCVLR